MSKINFSKTYLNTIFATETIFFFFMTPQHDFKPNLDFENLFSLKKHVLSLTVSTNFCVAISHRISLVFTVLTRTCFLVKFSLVFRIRTTPQRFFMLSFCGLSFFLKNWVVLICWTFEDPFKDFRAFLLSVLLFSHRVSLVTIGLSKKNGGFSSEVPHTM